MCRRHCLVEEERLEVSDMRKTLDVGKVSGWWTRRQTCYRSWPNCQWSRWRGAWRSRWPTYRGRSCVGEVQGETGGKECVWRRSRTIPNLTNITFVPLFALLLLILQSLVVALHPRWFRLSRRFSDMCSLPRWALELVQLPLVTLGIGQVRGFLAFLHLAAA